MKLKNKLKRSAILFLALLLASTSSLVVYAAVNYDSSQDPVVSLSGMKSYVESVLADIKNSIAAIEARLIAIELGGGGGGSSGGEMSGATSAQLAELIAQYDAITKTLASLTAENEKLRNDLTNTKNELQSLINTLSKQYEELESSLSSLSSSITNLKNQLSSTKTDVSTLQKNFKQIADLSTKLESISLKVNQLISEEGGDVTVLKTEVELLKSQLSDIIDQVGHSYEAVHVPYGATIIATDENGTLSFILRSGTAVAVSPFVEAGKMQGLNDLSDGKDIYNGEAIPLFHFIMIPRGSNDGRGVTVTSVEGAYFILGGNYKIVEAQ